MNKSSITVKAFTRPTLLALLVASALSGCSLVPTYERPELAVPARGTGEALKAWLAGAVNVIDWLAFTTASWKACVPLGATPLFAVMLME